MTSVVFNTRSASHSRGSIMAESHIVTDLVGDNLRDVCRARGNLIIIGECRTEITGEGSLPKNIYIGHAASVFSTRIELSRRISAAGDQRPCNIVARKTRCIRFLGCHVHIEWSEVLRYPFPDLHDGGLLQVTEGSSIGIQ